MDGWITIGTKLDTKALEKDIRKAESDLNKLEKESEKLEQQKVKVEIDLQEYEKQKALIQESTDEILKMAQTEEQVNNVLEAENMQLEQLKEKYASQFENLSKINTKIEENTYNQGLLNEKISEMNANLSKAKNFGVAKKSVEEVGKSVEKVTKKIGKWVLAIFSIRSAYLFVRQAMNTLSEYNDQLATKLSNIRLVLATALEPIINRIIGLVVKLLSYLNYITKTFFGLDLFARASELSTEKMNKELSAGAKSAKEIKKQLAGFDEMNVLQGQDTSGGTKEPKTPAFELQEVEVPQWFKDLVDFINKNKDVVISAIAGIITALELLKIKGLGPIKALGIGIMIAGIVYAIMSLIDYLKDPTWENFGKVITGIGIALLGLAIVIGNLPLAIIGAIVLIVGIVIKYWDQIKEFFETKILGWFDKKREAVYKKFGDFGLAIFDTARNFLKMILDIVDGQIKALRKIFDGIITFVKGVFTGNWKQALEGLKQIFGGVWDGLKAIVVNVWSFIKATVSNMAIATANAFKGIINGALNGLFGMIESVVNGFISNLNTVIKLINKIPGVNLKKVNQLHITRLATGGIINQPGRGVPIGGAIGGEAGREGVLPLTDERAMAMLGKEIGKWITINANIPVSVGNRQLGRVVKQIMAEDDFAMNN